MKTTTSKKVVIYTTPTCGYCKMAKQFFRDHNVAFKEHDVFVEKDVREEMISKSGQRGVPVITIDDELVVGFNQHRLSELLGIN